MTWSTIVRGFSEIVEFRSTVAYSGAMRTLSIEIEVDRGVADPSDIPARLSLQLREAIGLTVPVRIIEPGSLPRFEMKARRFVVEP
jgi:phenylacetate-CoA ligase